MLTLDLYQTWDDSHEQTAYPFADEASLLAVDNATRFPVGVIADAAIGARDLTTPVRLGVVDVRAGDIDLIFYQGSTVVAVATITTATSGWVPLTSRLGVVYAGKVKIESALVGAVFNLGLGTHTFTEAAAPLVPYCVFLAPVAGVRGIELPNGTVISGDITISIGSGLDAEVEDDGSVRIDAVGRPYLKRDDVVMIRRAIRRVEITTLSAGGATSSALLTPLRGTLALATDNTVPAKSPAVVVRGGGSEVVVEVAP
jgi:hypothetical protein